MSPNRRCLNQLNSWSEYEAAVNGATIAPPPRDWKKFDILIDHWLTVRRFHEQKKRKDETKVEKKKWGVWILDKKKKETN